MEPKQQTLLLLLLQLVLGVAFAITSFVTANSCFKKVEGEDVCPQGPGTDYLFKIKRGEGYFVVMSGLTWIALTAATIRLLQYGTSEMQFGMLLGANLFATLLTTLVGFNFGGFALMMGTFNCDPGIFFWVGAGVVSPVDSLAPNNGVIWSKLVCDGTGTAFLGIMVISLLLFFTHAAVCARLWIFRNDYISSSGSAYANLGGAGNPGMAPIGSTSGKQTQNFTEDL